MTSRRHVEQPRGQYSLFDATMPLRQEAEVDSLPKTAQYLVEVMGLEATIDLVKMFGGDELKIPDVIHGTSRMWDILVETIGEVAATKLVARCKGTAIYVPQCQALLRTYRDREIIRRYDDGVPFDTLRREHKLTRRHLFRVLKRPL